jgi:hypothetical protein
MERERTADEASSSGSTTEGPVRLPEAEDEIRPEEETPGSMPEAPAQSRMPEAPGSAGATTGETANREPLLPADSTGGYRDRWEQIQSRFVDDPRSSVEQADKLVIEVVQELQTSFGSERAALEAQWQRGDDVQTEDLRVALQRYRSFFDRLLSA